MEPGWSDWTLIPSGNFSPVSSPAACSWGPHRLDCFVTDIHGDFWYIYGDGTQWSAWEKLAGPGVADVDVAIYPAACSWGPNRIDLFAVVSSGLYHKWWNGSSWSEWENWGKNNPPVGQLAACCWGPNRIDLFGIGTDQAMYHKWWDGSQWNGWENLEGQCSSVGAASWGPNRIDIFTIGPDGSVYQQWWDTSQWSGWRHLGSPLLPLTVVTACASPALPGYVDCFAAGGKSNNIYQRSWLGVRWSSWDNHGGWSILPLAATSWGQSGMDLFMVGGVDVRAANLYHKWAHAKVGRGGGGGPTPATLSAAFYFDYLAGTEPAPPTTATFTGTLVSGAGGSGRTSFSVQSSPITFGVVNQSPAVIPAPPIQDLQPGIWLVSASVPGVVNIHTMTCPNVQVPGSVRLSISQSVPNCQ